MFTSNSATCLICKLNICQSILKSFKTLRTLTVRMSRHTSFPNALNCHILNMCLRASVTPATLWASVTLVTGQTKSMGQSEPDIILLSLVLHGEIVTHVVILFLSNTLTQVNILQLHRPARSRSRSYDSVSPRRHSRSTSLREGRRRSLIRRGNTLPLLVLLRAALPLLPQVKVKEKENGTSLKEEEETL